MHQLKNTDDTGEITGRGIRRKHPGINYLGLTGDHFEGTLEEHAGQAQWDAANPPTPAQCDSILSFYGLAGLALEAVDVDQTTRLLGDAGMILADESEAIASTYNLGRAVLTIGDRSPGVPNATNLGNAGLTLDADADAHLQALRTGLADIVLADASLSSPTAGNDGWAVLALDNNDALGSDAQTNGLAAMILADASLASPTAANDGWATLTLADNSLATPTAGNEGWASIILADNSPLPPVDVGNGLAGVTLADASLGTPTASNLGQAAVVLEDASLYRAGASELGLAGITLVDASLGTPTASNLGWSAIVLDNASSHADALDTKTLVLGLPTIAEAEAGQTLGLELTTAYSLDDYGEASIVLGAYGMEADPPPPVPTCEEDITFEESGEVNWFLINYPAADLIDGHARLHSTGFTIDCGIGVNLTPSYNDKRISLRVKIVEWGPVTVFSALMFTNNEFGSFGLYIENNGLLRLRTGAGWGNSTMVDISPGDWFDVEILHEATALAVTWRGVTITDTMSATFENHHLTIKAVVYEGGDIRVDDLSICQP